MPVYRVKTYFFSELGPKARKIARREVLETEKGIAADQSPEEWDERGLDYNKSEMTGMTTHQATRYLYNRNREHFESVVDAMIESEEVDNYYEFNKRGYWVDQPDDAEEL